MAVDYLSALNVGSGLNTTEIIDALVEARAPKASEIDSAKEKRTVEISSLGQIKQGFETFDTSIAPVEEITGLSSCVKRVGHRCANQRRETGNKLQSFHGGHQGCRWPDPCIRRLFQRNSLYGHRHPHLFLRHLEQRQLFHRQQRSQQCQTSRWQLAPAPLPI